jgi:hypothetical protein
LELSLKSATSSGEVKMIHAPMPLDLTFYSYGRWIKSNEGGIFWWQDNSKRFDSVEEVEEYLRDVVGLRSLYCIIKVRKTETVEIIDEQKS